MHHQRKEHFPPASSHAPLASNQITAGVNGQTCHLSPDRAQIGYTEGEDDVGMSSLLDTIRIRRRLRLLAVAATASFLIVACSAESGQSAVDAPFAEPASNKTEAADPAPDFQIEAFGNETYARGELVSLSTFEGKAVVLNFWYPSCPPCRLEIPHFVSVFNEHKGNGVGFVGVQSLILDTVEDGQTFVDEEGIGYAVGPDMDGSIAQNYSVLGYPTTVFLDKDHQIARKWTGVLNEEKLSEILQELLQ